VGGVAPPKLPETTNLVLTRSKNEYNEMKQMNVNVSIENRRPPLKKLKKIGQNDGEIRENGTYAFPRNSTPVPIKDLSNYHKISRSSKVQNMQSLP
jgi:hypothetical protein